MNNKRNSPAKIDRSSLKREDGIAKTKYKGWTLYAAGIRSKRNETESVVPQYEVPSAINQVRDRPIRFNNVKVLLFVLVLKILLKRNKFIQEDNIGITITKSPLSPRK